MDRQDYTIRRSTQYIEGHRDNLNPIKDEEIEVKPHNRESARFWRNMLLFGLVAVPGTRLFTRCTNNLESDVPYYIKSQNK